MGVIWWDKLAILGAFGGRLSADIREKVCNRLTAGKVFWKTWFVRLPPGWDMVCNRLTAGKDL